MIGINRFWLVMICPDLRLRPVTADPEAKGLIERAHDYLDEAQEARYS